jgi:hypothetical protein
VADVVGGEVFGRVVVDVEEVADGVVVFGPVEATGGDAAGVDPSHHLETEEQADHRRADVTGVVGGVLVGANMASAGLLLGPLPAVLGGVLVSQGLKVAFARPRPELAPHGAPVFTHSFPSGHAMMSAIVYLTIAALFARTQAMPRVKAFMFMIAAAVAILVGVSRVYLGVHWPTDVLAGWAAGCAWALGGWTLTYWLQRGGQVEPEDEIIVEEGDGVLTSQTEAARADSSPER